MIRLAAIFDWVEPQSFQYIEAQVQHAYDQAEVLRQMILNRQVDAISEG